MQSIAERLHDTLPNGTVSANGTAVPTTGYVVAIGGTRVRTCTYQAIQTVVDMYPDAHYYGVWSDDGFVYIDAVEIIGSLTRALERARERGEKAIYDLLTSQDVRV